jgi:hypothetical protein
LPTGDLPNDGWQEARALPRLAIDRDFLDDYSKLEKSVRTAVKEAIDKFAEHTYAGLHFGCHRRRRRRCPGAGSGHASRD